MLQAWKEIRWLYLSNDFIALYYVSDFHHCTLLIRGMYNVIRSRENDVTMLVIETTQHIESSGNKTDFHVLE